MDDLGEGIVSLRTWSRLARGSLLLFLLVQVVLILGNGLLLVAELSDGGVNRTMYDAYTNEAANVYNQLLAMVLGASVALLGVFFLLAVVPISLWIYRAHANLHQAGIDELGYSPGWSVGSFFVPLINFVIPLRAMRELHNRSHGEGPWQAQSPVADVASWWACHLAALLVLGVATFVAVLASIPNLYVIQPPGVNTGLFLFSLVLLAGSAAFLYRTIGAITSAQEQRLHLDQETVFG